MNKTISSGLCAFVAVAFATSGVAWANSAPDVTNVMASQRGDDSKLVDITYNLADADGDPCTVWVSVSDNGGVDWWVPARTFTGDIGMGVTPGAGKAVVWDAGADWNQNYSQQMRFRVTANDGGSSSPAGMVLIPADQDAMRRHDEAEQTPEPEGGGGEGGGGVASSRRSRPRRSRRSRSSRGGARSPSRARRWPTRARSRKRPSRR